MDRLDSNSSMFYKPSHSGSKKYWVILLILLALLGVVSAAWFFIVKSNGSFLVSPFGSDSDKKSKLSSKIINPITGVGFDDPNVAWANYRPLSVMVNNFVSARPQSGLDKADIVYEVVAEGGITRFLAFFLTNTPEKIGPVRSTREYYLVLVKELGDAMLMHIGYSPQALEAIETWPVRSLARGGADFWRDQARIDKGIAIEHTAYVNGVTLRDLGNKLGWEGTRNFKAWTFKEDKAEYKDTTLTNTLSIDFWAKGDYSAIFKYNESTNSYLRFTGYDEAGNPIPHVDQESNKQLEIKNVIVQFVPESSIAGDEKNRLDYQLVGSGNSLVFLDGKVIKSTWAKADRDSRTTFYDLNGKEIMFNKGNFWVSIVPDRNAEQVVY